MEITHGYITFQSSLEDTVWFQSLSHRCNVPRMCFVERSVRNTEDRTNCPNSSSSRSPHYTHNVPKSHSLLCSKHYSLVRTSADGKSYCHPLCCSHNVPLYCFALKNSELSSLVRRSLGGTPYSRR